MATYLAHINVMIVSLVVSLGAVSYSVFLAWNVLKDSLATGVVAYLKRQNSMMLGVGLLGAIALYHWFGMLMAGAFLVGTIVALGTHAISTMISASHTDDAPAIGFLVVGVALLLLTGWYWFAGDIHSLIGLSLGASLVAVAARVSGITQARVGVDVFETYLISVVSTMLLTSVLLAQFPNLMMLPLLIGSLALIASLIGSFGGTYKLVVTGALSIGLFYAMATRWPAITVIGLRASMAIFWSLMIGVGVTVLMGLIAEYYARTRTGAAIAMESAALPAVVMSAALYGAYHFAGIYGVALATMSMLSLASVSAKSLGKGYAIVSAGLASLILFASYTQEFQSAGRQIFFMLSDVRVVIGLLTGGMMVYLFGSLITREQHHETPRLAALSLLIPIVIPIVLGFTLGAEAVGGLLVGALITGLFVALTMAVGVGDEHSERNALALNSLIKSANLVALLIVRFIA